MLVAVDTSGTRYISTETTTIHREKGFYLCQECKQPIYLRLCLDKTSHFAHYPDDVECTGAWEQDTETHSMMKQDVYDYFKKFSWVKRIELEYPINIKEKIYLPDIYIETDQNHKIAVECQAHITTRDALLKRALAYIGDNIYPLFILEVGEFLGGFVAPRDDLYISPRFEEKSKGEEAFIQRFYIYGQKIESLNGSKDIINLNKNIVNPGKDTIYSIDVAFARISSSSPVGSHIETYETKTDFSSYKINISKIKYNSNDELIISEIPMIVDMQLPRFNFERIAKLMQEEELRERLRQQALNDKKKEDGITIVEKESQINKDEEFRRKREEEIRKNNELRLKSLREKLESINIDEPWGLYANYPGASSSTLLPPLTWKGGDQVSNLKTMLAFFKKFVVPDKTKIMIYKSFCGSGKSVTVLHVIRGMGRGIIVAPFKSLQRQYFDDYFKGNKFVMKKDGTALKVAVLLGRGNFECKWLAEQYDYQQMLVEESKKPENAGIHIPIDDFILNTYRYDKSTANRRLPCTRPLQLVRSGKKGPRWVTASQCPYWIPTPMSKQTIDQWQKRAINKEKTIEEQFDDDITDGGENIPDIKQNASSVSKTKTMLDVIQERIKCSTIKYYDSVAWGQVGIFIRDEVEKDGSKCPPICQYYQQFYSYIDADVIVMNSAKWHLETRIGRKPLTDVEVFDEGDYWLDSQASEIEFQRSTIDRIVPPDNKMQRMKTRALEIFDLSLKDIKAKIEQQRKTGDGRTNIVDAKTYNGLFNAMTETLAELIKSLEDDERIEEKLVDINTVLRYIDKASISYSEGKRKETKIIKAFIPYPDYILKDLFGLSSKNIIITSGTMHSNNVLSTLFGINADNYIVEMLQGRGESPGKLTMAKPKDGLARVTYSLWENSPQFKEWYNRTLNYILDNLKVKIDQRTGKPGEGKILVLTPAKKYADPIRNRPDVYVDFAKSNEDDDMTIKIDTTLSDYVNNTLEDVRKVKDGDINLDGDVLRTNKQIILSTRLMRGSDLRDDKCRAVVMTKWPYPDIGAGYNQALKKRFGDAAFDKIMSDKAEREGIQYVSRGLRHDNDWEIFSTPDEKAYNQIFRLFSYG